MIKHEGEVARVAMDFYCQDLSVLEEFIPKSNMDYTNPNPYCARGECILLTNSTLTGDNFFRFVEKETNGS